MKKNNLSQEIKKEDIILNKEAEDEKEKALKEELSKIEIQTLYDEIYRQYLKSGRSFKSVYNKISRKKMDEYLAEIDSKVEIKFYGEAEEEKWNLCKEVNKEGYAKRTIKFANDWIKLMQYLQSKFNRNICDVGYISSKIAGVDELTPMMYRYALSLMEELWYYGEQLRKI